MGLAIAATPKWKEHKLLDTIAEDFVVRRTGLRAFSGNELHVVRIQRGHPKSHIFLLPPDPGQGAKYWETELSGLSRVYVQDFVLYALDLRGIAHASPFYDDDNETWVKNGLVDYGNGLHSRDGSLSLSDLNIEGQASDLLEVVGHIKRGLNHTEKLYIHARAFGCLIAVKALETQSELFTGVVLESFLPISNWTTITNDQAYIETCLADEFCNKKLGMDANQFRIALASLGSRNLNKCTNALFEALEREISFSQLDPKASDWHRLNEIIGVFMRLTKKGGSEKYPSSMFVFPIIQTLYVCHDPERFEKIILPDIIKLVKKIDAAHIQSFDVYKGVNRFVNVFLMLNEVFNLGSAKRHVCHGPLTLGLASPCVFYRYYLKYAKIFRSYLRRGPSSDFSQISAPNTNIVFLAGALDLISPPSAIADIYNKTKAKEKRLYVFKTLPGMPLRHSLCASKIGNEMLHGGSGSDVLQCLESANKNGLDWEFKELTNIKVRDWWSQNTPVSSPKEEVKNKEVVPKVDITWYLTILTFFVGTLGILAVATHIGWTVWKRRCDASDPR